MRFLGVLYLRGIDARALRHIFVAMQLGDDAAALRDGLARHGGAVRAHIGDEADRFAAKLDAFIESLCDLHGARRREAELARSFLLQGRGDEGRRRVTLERFLFNLGDGEMPALDRRHGAFGVVRMSKRQFVELLAVEMGKPGGEISRRRGEVRFDGPIFLGLEGFDLELALADEAQRDRLHAARRTRPRQLAPQHRREREPDQIVERAARQIGVHQFFVDGARMGDGIEHGRFRDRVEDDALHFGLAQDAALLERLQDMPGNGFALAVGVGGEDQRVGALHRIGDLLETLLCLGIDLPDHGKIGVGIDRAVLGGQVPHMPIARQYKVIRTKIFVDGLGLGGRFDHNDAGRF